MTVVTAPLAIVGLKLFGPPINASPPDEWETPIAAPSLPKSFKPQSMQYGKPSDQFDEGFDAPGESRDKDRERDAHDPYGEITARKKNIPGSAATDAPRGDSSSEASLRYEHHALLRMQARREGLYKPQDPVKEEDNLSTASPEYLAWRSEKIKETLAKCIDTHATDHSTIMTNAEHARLALSYDVAVGVCQITREKLGDLRVSADWRYLDGLSDESAAFAFSEYFLNGTYLKQAVSDWAVKGKHQGSMPDTIINKRKFL